jgi:hypothetical protein
MKLAIHTETTIAADTATVWSVLSDVAGYPAWNPYHERVAGELIPGRKLVVDISKPNGDSLTIKPRVIRVEPGRELTWGGGITGVFRGEHRFVLEPVDGGTRLIHSEEFTGLAVRFAHLDSIQEGYELMNAALRTYVEDANAEAAERPGVA